MSTHDNCRMQYRHFPLIEDVEVSALGLGCMRLPVISGDDAAIDPLPSMPCLLKQLLRGLTISTRLICTISSKVSRLGAALERSGTRDHFFLATKMPVGLVKTKDDWERFLVEQLERLQTDHIDFYLFHGLGFDQDRWPKIKALGGLTALERAKAAGTIRHLGFSFHGSFERFKEIVDGYDGWEFCQLQYNYVDRNSQAGEEGLAYAAGHKLGVIIMEPLRGGSLAKLPSEVEAAFRRYPTPRPPYEWGLRYVLDRPEVSLVLSGMGSIDQIRENAAVASSVKPNTITPHERAMYEEAGQLFKERERVHCTGCRYCQPCPSRVHIPEIFSCYNTASMVNTKKDMRNRYKAMVARGLDAGSCIRCGECMSKCPQGIDIPDG